MSRRFEASLPSIGMVHEPPCRRLILTLLGLLLALAACAPAASDPVVGPSSTATPLPPRATPLPPTVTPTAKAKLNVVATTTQVTFLAGVVGGIRFS
jgi:hypothetical protein